MASTQSQEEREPKEKEKKSHFRANPLNHHTCTLPGEEDAETNQIMWRKCHQNHWHQSHASLEVDGAADALTSDLHTPTIFFCFFYLHKTKNTLKTNQQ
jgi:hypothetical protein